MAQSFHVKSEQLLHKTQNAEYRVWMRRYWQASVDSLRSRLDAAKVAIGIDDIIKISALQASLTEDLNFARKFGVR